MHTPSVEVQGAEVREREIPGIWPKRVCFAEFQGLESETGNKTSIFNVFNRVYFSVNKCERAGDGRSTLTFCDINNIYVKRTNPMMLV